MEKIISSDEVKQLLLAIVKSIDGFCREKGLRYSIAYGSLIGAVRHKGFIPWDDDIDIFMPRPDYEKLLKEFKHPFYEIRSQENIPEWPLNFSKMCDVRTISIDQFGNKTPIAVDIFILDGVGNSIKEAEKTVNSVEKIHRLWSNQLFTRSLSFDKKYGVKKNLFIFFGKIVHLFLPFNLVLNYLLDYKKKRSIDKSKYCSSLHGSRLIYESSRMLEYEDATFENLVLKIPKDYDYQLKIRYGEYMIIPPECEQINHEAKAYWI